MTTALPPRVKLNYTDKFNYITAQMKTSIPFSKQNYFDSSKRGWLAIEELKGILKYRELIRQLIRRDLISRYKRSVLGVAWTLLTPLGTMLILTLVFSNLFHSVQNYPVYVLTGLIAWNFFSQTISSALHQNVWGGSLYHRIFFPRTALTIASVGNGIVNAVIALIPLGLIMLLLSFPFSVSLLFLPVSILIMGAFTLGLSLLLSALAIYFPDVVDMVQVALTAWMYLTPVIYPAEIIPETYRAWMFKFNPLYYLVEILRQPIYAGKIPSGSILITGTILAAGMLLIGWTIFSWKANELTYRT